MTTEITVTTQAEWDAAIAAHGEDADARIIINSPAGIWLHIDSTGRASAVLRGSSSAVLRGSSRAELWESSSAVLRESSSAHAHDRSCVDASRYAAVHLHSQAVTISGGVVIDMTAVDRRDPQTWCDLVGVAVDEDGNAHLYKAVDDGLRSSQGFAYPLGETLADPHWRDDHSCGGGLHVSPTPSAARSHFGSVTRFLEVAVPLDGLRPIDSTKGKCPVVTVLCEVDIDGRPVQTGAQAS